MYTWIPHDVHRGVGEQGTGHAEFDKGFEALTFLRGDAVEVYGDVPGKNVSKTYIIDSDGTLTETGTGHNLTTEKAIGNHIWMVKF